MSAKFKTKSKRNRLSPIEYRRKVKSITQQLREKLVILRIKPNTIVLFCTGAKYKQALMEACEAAIDFDRYMVNVSPAEGGALYAAIELRSKPGSWRVYVDDDVKAIGLRG